MSPLLTPGISAFTRYELSDSVTSILIDAAARSARTGRKKPRNSSSNPASLNGSYTVKLLIWISSTIGIRLGGPKRPGLRPAPPLLRFAGVRGAFKSRMQPNVCDIWKGCAPAQFGRSPEGVIMTNPALHGDRL